MKKVSAIFTAAVLSAGIAAVCSAERITRPYQSAPYPIEEYGHYQPYFYFKTKAVDNCHQLKNDTIYVNTSAIPETGAHYSDDMYFCDKFKMVQSFFAKYAYDTDQIKIVSFTNCAEEYPEVYKNQASAPLVHHDNTSKYPYEWIQFSKPSLSLEPLDVLTEHTDDYPLTRIVSEVLPTSASGKYELYLHPDIPGHAASGLTILYPGDDKHYGDNPAYSSLSQFVMVSNRELGDVFADGKIDAKDASEIMNMYGKTISYNDSQLDTAEEIAADVNADGIIDDKDIELVLDYDVSDISMSFYDFLPENS